MTRAHAFILSCAVGCVSFLGVACDKKDDAPAAPAVAASAAASVAAPAPKPAKAPLKIAYSDWPGWTAFEIGIQKGWFKEAGVDVEFSWFEYAPSMEAFTAGKVDAVMMTIGDALVTGAPGARSVAILVTDYSNGNDMIVAKPGINEPQGPQGQEDRPRDRRWSSTCCFCKGLEKVGLKETDVKLVNVPDPPRRRSRWRRAASTRSAAGSRTRGRRSRRSPGSKAIFTSADVPGLIYDLVGVNPQEPRRRARRLGQGRQGLEPHRRRS